MFASPILEGEAAMKHPILVVLVGGLLTISGAAMGQIPGQAPGLGFGTSPVLPPSTIVAPNATPSPNQQLDIQSYQNQLELRQRSDAGAGTAGLRDQLNAGEQLNQLNMMQTGRPVP
jgi:hypothetical protein